MDRNNKIEWNNTCKESDFEFVFSHFYAPLCAYANKITLQQQVSEELVQDLFLHLWDNKHKLNIENLKSYLYSSIYHKALHHIEHQSVKLKYDKSLIASNHVYPSPEDAMITDELYRVYRNELDQIPPNTRHIFKMSRYSDMTYKEIAQKLNISVKTVESHISKALKAFRTVFSKHTDYKY